MVNQETIGLDPNDPIGNQIPEFLSTRYTNDRKSNSTLLSTYIRWYSLIAAIASFRVIKDNPKRATSTFVGYLAR